MRLFATISSMMMLVGFAAGATTELAPRAPDDSDVSFGKVTVELSHALNHVDKFEIYEGLPHPFEGKKFLENEILTKKTVLFDENLFYLPARTALVTDEPGLKNLLSGGLFKPWRGVKFCGGFHGDYAVSFDSKDVTYLVILCFGCREARILGLPKATPSQPIAKGFRLTTDLAKEKFHEVREFFKKYQLQRPPPPKRNPIVAPPDPPRVSVQL